MTVSEANEQFTRHWTAAQPIVSGYVRTVIRDPVEAGEILQNVAVVLLHKFDDYDPARPFVGWALGVARFEVLAARRDRSRERLIFDSDLLGRIATACEELSPAAEERIGRLRECLMRVRGRAREALHLRYFEDRKPRDIARAIGTSAGAVRVMLNRIRTALRDCVERRAHLAGEP